MAGTDRLNELAESMGERLVLPTDPAVVALSGGADSAALLWLLVRRGAEVSAVHVFHGLPASSFMSAAAGQVAASCGVPLDIAVVEPEGTSETLLRHARHEALLERAGDRPVLLAHTSDDQAETVLMRIFRGTGVAGLVGIPVARDRIWHPMLDISRQETRELATLAGLPFRDDPANDDRAVLRNRVRLDLLPAIAEATGGAPREALVRLATAAADDSGVLDALSRAVPIEEREGAVRLPIGALRAAGDAVAARALRTALVRVAGPYPPDRAALDRVLDVVAGSRGGTEIHPGLRVRTVDAHLVIDSSSSPSTARPAPTRLAAEGRTGWADWRFEARIVAGPAVAPLSPRRIVGPADREAWEVRAWQPDDRVTGKRVGAALEAGGVPAAARADWPLVTLAGEPVWVPGVRSRVWPVHPPGRYLCVVAVREPTWHPFEP